MRRFRLIHLAMLAPAQGLLLSALAIPSLYVLWLSFTQSSYGGVSGFIGWANYADIWNDRYFWRSLTNTGVVINVIIYLELAAAVIVALVFARGVPFRPFFLTLIILPYGISEVVAVIIWKSMMDPATGALARSLAGLGFPELNWATDPAVGLGLVAVVSIWLHFPFTFLLIYAAILAIPKEMFEAADIDGASAWQAFRHVTVPAILPTVLIALIFRYILAFRLFTEVWLLTGGGPARRTEVMAIYLYKQAFTYANFGRGAAMGWIMVVCSGLVAIIYVAMLYRSSFARNG